MMRLEKESFEDKYNELRIQSQFDQETIQDLDTKNK